MGRATGGVVEAAYQIEQLGQPTNNWIVARLYESNGDLNPACYIYQGNPDAGGTLAKPSPFICEVAVVVGNPHPAKFSISMNRDAEASGFINTTGPVSLAEGKFETEPLLYHVDGLSKVAMKSSTYFEVVLRVGDQLIIEGLAKSLYVYRFIDNGAPTQFYIVGYSQNYRGTTKFSPEAKCGIYDGDASMNATPLSQQTPAATTPYTCEVTSENFIGYR